MRYVLLCGMAALQLVRGLVGLVVRSPSDLSMLVALTAAGRIVTASVGRRILYRWLTARLVCTLVGVVNADIHVEDKDDDF